MSTIPPDVQCFDVEVALSKALGKKVETFYVDPHTNTYKFRIGYKWNLQVDLEQLGALWDNYETPSAIRDTFNELKGACLGFQSHN